MLGCFCFRSSCQLCWLNMSVFDKFLLLQISNGARTTHTHKKKTLYISNLASGLKYKVRNSVFHIGSLISTGSEWWWLKTANTKDGVLNLKRWYICNASRSSQSEFWFDRKKSKIYIKSIHNAENCSLMFLCISALYKGMWLCCLILNCWACWSLVIELTCLKEFVITSKHHNENHTIFGTIFHSIFIFF